MYSISWKYLQCSAFISIIKSLIIIYTVFVREALPQFLAVGAKNLLLLTFGSSLGFATILIPELQKSNAVILVTLEEITWIGSINLFLLPLGGFASGVVSQKLGRRRTMMISTIPFIIAWIIFYNAVSNNMLFIAQALTGLTGGLLEAPVLTYVAEVTQPHLRGMLSATSTMAVMCGVFTQMLTGSLVEWRTVALINLIYPILCFISLYLVPESPTWLAGQGHFQKAEKSLCWLRGWVNPEDVKEEFQDLCRNFQKSINMTSIHSITLKNNIKKQESAKKIWEPYLKKTFYLPFSIVALTFFVNAFGGVMVLQVFAVVILDELKTPIDKYQGIVIIGIAQVVGTMICVFIIHFTGLISLHFILPETEGRTLKEIENHFAGVYNLKNNSNKKNLNFKEKWAIDNPHTVNDELENRI
ncbi:PREDICTED: facilitated trehalose transporter Tret1 [Ceratosolen solmsi marchali]|uniref:Facilitated trehalose transporter Tret1 n=1 Tax=Ceratosolen solmsi marchali TaxID=326594 RepID=A0AAJ6VM38_9HYME|nr:PREDICTED: facilitated trehalose transporter Tret1 [Ceratosolen solmsi marchali]